MAKPSRWMTVRHGQFISILSAITMWMSRITSRRTTGTMCRPEHWHRCRKRWSLSKRACTRLCRRFMMTVCLNPCLRMATSRKCWKIRWTTGLKKPSSRSSGRRSTTNTPIRWILILRNWFRKQSYTSTASCTSVGCNIPSPMLVRKMFWVPIWCGKAAASAMPRAEQKN